MVKYSSGLKERVKALLKYYVDSGEKGLEGIKSKENLEIYKTFVDVCLVQLKDAHNWTFDCDHKKISEIFTASDEAMAALYFENYVLDFQKMSESGMKITKSQSRSRFTNSSKNDKTCQGWHVDGIKRYNTLIMAFIENRNNDECSEFEEEIRNEMVAFKHYKDSIDQLNEEQLQCHVFYEQDYSDDEDVDAIDEMEFEKSMPSLNGVGV